MNLTRNDDDFLLQKGGLTPRAYPSWKSRLEKTEPSAEPGYAVLVLPTTTFTVKNDQGFEPAQAIQIQPVEKIDGEHRTIEHVITRI